MAKWRKTDEDGPAQAAPNGKAGRDARLAGALRANLAKRKAQARARGGEPDVAAADADENPD